jgi:hypothetical protein
MRNLKYLIFILILHSPFAFSADLHIFSLTKQENVGDKNQILGIVDEISSRYRDGHVIYKEFQASAENRTNLRMQLESEIKPLRLKKDRFLFLAVGDYGIEAIQQVATLENLKTCYLAHQLMLGINQLIGKTDRIILPKHSLNAAFINQAKHSKTKVIPIIGVLHHLKAADLVGAYQRSKEVIPRAEAYLGVILAGDAPDSEGKIRFFEQVEAIQLATFIGNRALKSKATVLVLNGPRTGKHFPTTLQVDPSADRSGSVDLVTSAFMKQLSSIIPAEKIKLFDFQFDRVSHYQTVLGALLGTPAELFVPGESTSMVSETVDHFPGHVTIYENGAMNSSHQAHVQSEFQAGRASLLTRSLQYHPVQMKHLEALDNSRTRVAKEILRFLK